LNNKDHLYEWNEIEKIHNLKDIDKFFDKIVNQNNAKNFGIFFDN